MKKFSYSLGLLNLSDLAASTSYIAYFITAAVQHDRLEELNSDQLAGTFHLLALLFGVARGLFAFLYLFEGTRGHILMIWMVIKGMLSFLTVLLAFIFLFSALILKLAFTEPRV